MDPTFSEGVNEFSLKATKALSLLKGPTITKRHLNTLSPSDMPMGLHGLAKTLD